MHANLKQYLMRDQERKAEDTKQHEGAVVPHHRLQREESRRMNFVYSFTS